ncbi:hypothetical protein [Corynebacterium sp. LaCa142]
MRLFPLSRAAAGFVAISATAALGMSVLTPVAAAGETHPPAETCPDYVFLAARGSDQNEEHGEYFGPQRYSD